MRHISLALALPLAIAITTTVPASGYAQELGIAVGTAAPAAAVQTLDGRAVNLSEWIGKTPVVLEFWATWCPNCKELEPAMVAAARKHGDRVKFVAVAVSVNQSPERVRRYQEKYKLPMTFVYDDDGNATDVYEAPATSYVVVIDRDGKVVYTGLGGKQDLKAAIARVGGS